MTPRWEWRTFGERFGAAEGRLAAHLPERVEHSDDMYLLPLSGDPSIKIRSGILDVKQLDAVRDDGLQRWRPVLKARFPLAADDVRTACAALEVDVPPGRITDVDSLIAATPGVRAMPVNKRRTHYTVGGCLAEISELSSAAGSTRTIAVESEDPDRVAETVRALGFGGRANVCMARGLRILLGTEDERCGVIDVGTNSVKFHLAERRRPGWWRALADRAVVTRLGEGLDRGGRLAARPVERTIDALAGIVDEAARHGAEALVAVGTAVLRLAPNAGDLLGGA